MSKFSTTYYELHDIPTGPNGDKLRSDEAGPFFWIEGERVPYPIPPDWVPRSQRQREADSPKRSKKSGTSGESDLDQGAADANG
jgi:hypothetical protein